MTAEYAVLRIAADNSHEVVSWNETAEAAIETASALETASVDMSDTVDRGSYTPHRAVKTTRSGTFESLIPGLTLYR